jgi:hypothetical protein
MNRQDAMLRAVLILTWIGLATTASLVGLDYYLTPIQERPFLEGHELFASSAVVGHGYGVLGSAMMLIGVSMYSTRKRVMALAKLGKLRTWLQIHIFLCTLGPFFILLHSTFRVGGLVSIAFWSMALVVASGIFGRYLYVRIPKTLQGTFLSLEAVEARRADAFSTLKDRESVPGPVLAKLSARIQQEKPRNLPHAILLGLQWDFTRKKREKEIRNFLEGTAGSPEIKKEVLGLALNEARLGLEVALLGSFQRLFRYWHVFHLTLAIVMFLILAVHVTVAVLFGYGWVF